MNETARNAGPSTGRNTWLHADRARAYACIMAVGLSIAACVSALFIMTGSGNPGRRSEGVDFVAFRAAAVMAARGEDAQIYLPAPMEREERAEAWIAGPGYYPVMYPPSFLLLLLPLSLFSYASGYVLFVGGGLVILAALLSKVLPGRFLVDRIIPTLAFSGVLVNFEAGQNGLLTAAAMAGGMVWLDRRPIIGGACLGLLLCKPHLAIAAPWILLMGRRWSALCGFTLCATGLFVVSSVVFGLSSWAEFAIHAPMARAVLEALPANSAKMGSIFAGLRLLGCALPAARLVHALFAVAAIVISGWLARTNGQAAAALIASSALLITPYLFDYDLACLAIPLAWLLQRGVDRGFLFGERVLLVSGLLLPVALRPFAIGLGLPAAPIVLLGVFAAVSRRAWACPAPHPPKGQRRRS